MVEGHSTGLFAPFLWLYFGGHPDEGEFSDFNTLGESSQIVGLPTGRYPNWW
jgi:hypothetical protein